MKRSFLLITILVLTTTAGLAVAQDGDGVATPASPVPTHVSPGAQNQPTPAVQKPLTLEQVENQLQGLYIEAGARVERIRVAQGELEQIKQSIEQLTTQKQKLTRPAPSAQDGATTSTTR